MATRRDYRPGDRFGAWTVESEAPKRGKNRYLWCICECGERKAVHAGNLNRSPGGCRACYNRRRISPGAFYYHASGYEIMQWRLGGQTVRLYWHRVVMERELGRPLRDDETVHHINGNRSDNRPENLQLRQGQHGSGVVMTCGDCGSHNILPAKLD